MKASCSIPHAPTPNPKKIKICQVITRLDWGGAPDVVRILCRGLAQRGYEVVLISGPLKNPSTRTREFLAEHKIRHSVIPSLQRDINLLKDVAAFIDLWKLCRKERFAVVHTHTAKAGALGRIAARLAGVKRVVHTPHGHNFYGYFSPVMSRVLIQIERWLAGITSRLLVLTRAEKNDSVAYHVAPADRVQIIGTALEDLFPAASVRTALREDVGALDETILIGMAGRLEPIKGPDLFVSAAEEVAAQNPHCRFVITGEGSMRLSLEQRVAVGILRGRTYFLGWRDDVRDLIAGLDILVLASRNEAVGLVLLEAQAAGVPVIATRVGGVADVIQDGESGILVPSENVAALAEAIQRLAADHALRKRMGEAGKRFVEGRFRPEDFVGRVIGAYES